MHPNSCAPRWAEGRYGSHRGFQSFTKSMQRAAVNIYKTENSYEMLVFAPMRVKENFNVQVKGEELVISYTPPENLPRPDWVRREYSRGGFERSFLIDESINTEAITAVYKDGTLQVSLPLKPEVEVPGKDIAVG